MQIRYQTAAGVMIVFPVSELKVALSVLKAINKVEPRDFLKEAIKDIEHDLRPKLTLVPTKNYFHLCEKCHRDMDERDANSLNLVTETNDKWVHHNCPPLKKNRPV